MIRYNSFLLSAFCFLLSAFRFLLSAFQGSKLNPYGSPEINPGFGLPVVIGDVGCSRIEIFIE